MNRLKAYIVGFSYCIQSFGLPIGSSFVKPYQILSLSLLPNSIKTVNFYRYLFFLLFYYVISFIFYNPDVFDDSIGAIFILLIAVYSIELINIIDSNIADLAKSISIVYAVGVFFYLYTFFYGGILVDFKDDIIARSELTNTISSFIFFDGEFIRYNGFTLDPNFYSFYVNIFLGIYLLTITNKNYKLNRLFVFLSTVSVVLTFSRIGILCLFSLLFSYYYSFVMNKKLFIYGCMFSLFISVLLLLYFDFSLDGNERLSLGDINESRLGVWLAHINILINDKYILFGQGLKLSVVQYLSEYNYEKSSHNSLIYISYCFGIVGFIASINWYVRKLILIITCFDCNKILFCTLHLVFLLHLFTLDVLFTIPFHLYILYLMSINGILKSE